jgi:hypothetical protein
MFGRRDAFVLALTLALLGAGCATKEGAADKDSAKQGSTVDKPAGQLPRPSGASAANSAPEYLVPPTQYGESDLIRALLVDSDQVYFATLSEVYRVPLQGGPSAVLSKTPGTTLSGEIVLRASGERLLMQSTREPILMESSKAGGLWTTFLDLTSGKVGGGRDRATRSPEGLGKRGGKQRATLADFDGKDFYFADQKLGPKGEVLSSRILSVPLAGGTPKVLLEAPGAISDVHRLGPKIVFSYTKPPSAAALAEYEKALAKTPHRQRPSGPSGVFVLTPGEGEPKLLMAISHIMSSVFMVGDDSQVILSGFEDGNLKTGGLYRVALAGGSPQLIDSRAVSGQGFDLGDAFVVAGTGQAKNGTIEQGEIALIVPKTRGEVRQVSALVDPWTTHARALVGETLLLARYNAQENRAAIQRVSLGSGRPREAR